jgi:biopolymer transport protein ExbB
MKLASFFLALMLSAATLFGQDTAGGTPNPPVLLAQAATATKRDDVINDKGAAEPAPPKDSFAIHSAPTAQKSNDTVMNLWELVLSGGWAMVPLGFLSVVTMMLILVYTFTLRRGAILTPHYMNTADVLLKKRDYLGLLAISSRHSEVVARIVQRTLDFATKNPGASYDTIRDIAETEGGSQAASLQHRVAFLADIGVLSPMVGLLGTVSGIIRAFAKLGSGDASLSRDILLASGVSEALIATASGLILGILAMGFYALFRNRVHSLISDMEIASAHILGLLGVSYNKKRDSSRIAVEDEF